MCRYVYYVPSAFRLRLYSRGRKTVDAYYGDRYFGSDGDYYYSPESHQYIAYDENGNTSLHSASGVHRRTKLMIKDSSGSRQIMCIESGIDYNAGGTYSSVNGKNSSYFRTCRQRHSTELC